MATKYDLRSWGEFTNSPCRFDSIQLRQSNIQQNQVRLQCLREFNGLLTIRRFANGLHFQFVLKGCPEDLPKGFKIIYYQNPN